LEASNRGRIACLVLDVRMAGMSGIDVPRHVATGGVALPNHHADGARRRREAVAPDRARRPASTSVHGSTSRAARMVTEKRG